MKSVKINSVLNTIKTLVSLIFPIITYPYALRALGADNIGHYTFAKTIVNYCVLLAGLGISRYATREGARYRDDKKKFNEFASEMLSINLGSTIVAYTVLVIVFLASPKIQGYADVIWIQSLVIIFTTLGMDWLYSCLEEYLFVTIRSIIVQLISIVALFVFVRNSSDIIAYTWVLTFSTVGSYAINFIYILIKISLKLTFKHFRINIVPIMLLFVSSIASTIYVNSDSTMLGLLKDDYTVGLYDAATKIYTVAQQILSAALLVTLPRLSNYWGKEKKKEYWKLVNDAIDYVITFVTPAVIGLFLMAYEVIVVVAGKQYTQSADTLRILSLSLFCSLFGIFYTNTMLLPQQKEKEVSIIMVIAAAVNIGLNLIFIPAFAQNGAAITTLIAEFIVLIFQIIVMRDIFSIEQSDHKGVYTGTLVGSIVVCIVCILSKYIVSNIVIRLALATVISILFYLVIQRVIGNHCVDFILKRRS